MGLRVRLAISAALVVALVVGQVPATLFAATDFSGQIAAQADARFEPPPPAPGFGADAAYDLHTVVAFPGDAILFGGLVTNTGTTTWALGTSTEVNLSICVQTLLSRNLYRIECDQPSPNATWELGWASSTRYASQPVGSIGPGEAGFYRWRVIVPEGQAPGRYVFLAALLTTSGARIATFQVAVLVPSGTVYNVNSNADTDSCTIDVCTLRGAINGANGSPETDTIVFALGEGNVIAPSSLLPDITDGVIIDATTDPDYQGTPVVELNGTDAGGGSGLTLRSGSAGSTIRGLVINRFRRWGIEATAGGNGLIVGNFIGTDPTGTSARGNGTSGSPNGGGILLLTPDYKVGTELLGDGNLISGNLGAGIEIGNADAPNTVVTQNIIGRNIADTANIPNTGNGIYVGSPDATVQDNVVAGNAGSGIAMAANRGDYLDNFVRGNAGSGILMSGSNNIFDKNDIRSNGGGVFMGFPFATTTDNVFTDNIVRNNTGRGFELRGSSLTPSQITERNAIRRGSISGNTLEGIILASGANNGIDPPRITEVVTGEGLLVRGTAEPGALVDIYVDPDDEGLEYLGTAIAGLEGDWVKSGGWAITDLSAVITALEAGTRVVRATQTRQVGEVSAETSEFSDVVQQQVTGTASCGEGFIANATVQLIQNGVVLATTTSDAEGNFTFADIGAGTFTVKFIYLVDEFEQACTVELTVDGSGEGSFGEAEQCDTSNTWLTAETLRATAGTDPLNKITGVICDGGRRWYKIEMPAGGFIVPPLSRIVARLTGTNEGDLSLPGDFTLMLVKDPRLALQPVATSNDAHTQFAGDTFGGDTFGGDTFGGDTFGGDTFGGDTFGGDTFGGDTFGGDTFGGDTFGGDTFGGDTFGGDTFGGDTFGGDTFGGDTFGGDTFGGDTFGGDTFGDKLNLAGGDPQAYAAAIARSVVRVAAHRGTSPEGLWQNTWANSVTWYLRVSSYRGSAGAFHISAQVFAGLCDGVSTAPVVSSRTVPTSGFYETLILRNSALEGPGSDPNANGTALSSLTTHPTVNGYIVDFAGDMSAAYSQFQTKAFCPAAANLLADGIRGYVKAFRAAHPELRWILIAASDVGVPLYRVPDSSKLAPQSMLVLPLKPETVEGELRLNFFGTDDGYADFDPILNNDHFVFQPELGVGRISEPKYIPSLVASYRGVEGVLRPTTAGVYGYNFWSDSANNIRAALAETGAPPPGQLLRVNQFQTAHPTIQSGQGLPTDPDAWNAQDLLDGFAADTDIFVLMAHGLRAGHIAPASYPPAAVPASQLIQVGNTTPAIKRMKLLISGACNFALAVPGDQRLAAAPDPETAEIPQALGWSAIAWNAYAYGDDTKPAYSEELAEFFVRELRYGTGAIAIGDALWKAKRAWATPDMELSGIPEKSLMTMGIIGFPMLKVDLGTAGRLTRPSDLASFTSADLQPVAAGTPGSNPALNLRTKDVNLDFTIDAHKLVRNDVTLVNLDTPGTTTASYYSVQSPGNQAGQVQMTPFQPIGPRWVEPLHPSDLPADSATFARGTVLTSATCLDVQSFVPLVSVPAYQFTPPRGPFFADRFTPNDWWKISYLTPDREFLLVSPAHYRSATSATGAPEIFGTERTFRDVSFRVYYSSLLTQTIETLGGQTMQAILAGPPEFRSHTATPNGDAIDFKVFMSGLPNLGIQSVFVTWWDTTPNAACALNSIELTRTESTEVGQHWAASLPLGGRDPANVRYLLQAVNGAGRVRVADNFGLGFPAETPPTAQVPLADTNLAFTTPATAASTFSGRTIDVAAKLERADTDEALSGKRLVFRLTGVSGERTFAYTGADGVATARLTVDALPGTLFAYVEFETDDDFNGNSARSVQITVNREPTSFVSTGIDPATQQQGGIVNVTAQLRDGLGRRLREQAVFFLVTAPACTGYVAGAAGCAVLQATVTETDFRGDARASFALAVPLGSYNVHAAFAGDIQVPPGVTLDLENARYVPARANLGGLTVTNQRILFASGRTGNGDIYSMNIDGTGLTRLTDHTAADEDPDWSADRKKIAFTSKRTGNGDIYVMNSDGSGVTRLTTSAAVDTFASWSPDGTKIVFTTTRDGNAEIYVMNADGSGQTRLTNNTRIDGDAYWSPDGTKIAFTSTRDGNSEIYLMNANGSGVVRLTNHPAVDTLGSWSPDGAKIAFTSTRTGTGDVYTMNADGTGVTRLTTTAAIDATPDWSPDGTQIVFATTRDGNFEIYVMNADGSSQTRRTNHSSFDILPGW